jgi:hypothetical protein
MGCVFNYDEYKDLDLEKCAIMMEIDVQNPDYLDHFIMDGSEYSAYPEECEVVVGEYNIYKIINMDVVVHSGDTIGYVRFVFEPQPHSKSDWVNIEQITNGSKKIKRKI